MSVGEVEAEVALVDEDGRGGVGSLWRIGFQMLLM